MKARILVKITLVTLAVVAFATACGGGGGSGGSARQATPGGSSASAVGGGLECPYLPAAQVSDATGIDMDTTLSSETDCEWVAKDDSAISTSLTTLSEAEFSMHVGETPVEGVGDEAYVEEGLLPTLWVRTGDARFELTASDLNDTGRLDAKGSLIAMGRFLAGG